MKFVYKKSLIIFLFFFSILNFYGCDGSGSGDGTVTIISTYNAGTLDATFNMDGIVVHDNAADGIAGDDRGKSITLDSAKNVYVTGSSWNGTNHDMVIWKYNSNGNFDRSFDNNGIVVHDNAAGGNGNDLGRSIFLDSFENVYVTGASSNGNNNDMVIWKYKNDGTLDTTFGGDGIVVYDNADAEDYGNSIVLDTIGNIYITGSSDDDMMIWKYTSNGTLDTSFDNDGVIVHDNAAGGNSVDIGRSIAIDSAGNLYVTGSSINSSGNDDVVIWKYRSDAILDTSFGDNGIVIYDNKVDGDTDDEANSIAIDPSGKICVTGVSRNIDNPNLSSMLLLKYKTTGDPDITFNGNGVVLQNNAAGGLQAQGNSISVNTAGDIYVAGSGLNVLGKQDVVIWKYKSGGYLDSTFSADGIVVHSNAAGGYGDDIGNSIVWDNLGKIYVTGQSYNADANNDMVIWKYR